MLLANFSSPSLPCRHRDDVAPANRERALQSMRTSLWGPGLIFLFPLRRETAHFQRPLPQWRGAFSKLRQPGGFLLGREPSLGRQVIDHAR
jgi:hypothetical protein